MQGGDLDYGRFDVVVTFVHVTAHDDFAFAVVDHFLEACPLLVVDYAAEVIGCACTIWVELFHRGLHLRDERLEDLLIDENVILRKADLSRIDDLTPEESASCQACVRVLGNYGWIATSELKGDRRQGFCGLFGDD